MSVLVVIGVPLLLALLVLVPRLRRLTLSCAPWAALPAFVFAVCAKPGLAVVVPSLLLGAHFGVDATARIFLLFTALLWTCAGVYAKSYLHHDDTRYRFFAFFLLTMSGNLGLILAQDMVSFYFLFALMTFAAYGVIVHDRSEEAYRAGRVYLSMAVLGEVMIVTALMLIASTTGELRFPTTDAGYTGATTRDLIIALILIGFGIKVGVVPLHVWLPLAHPVAPTPASAVLSGAMIKAGLLGWIRFLPLGQINLPGWSDACITLGVCTALYGALIGVTQQHPKTVLAYSSISQMGFLAVGVGLGFCGADAWSYLLPVVCLYALHHGLAKGALFLSVGVANAQPASAWGQRLLDVGMLFPALAIAGAPLTSGAVAKSALKEGLHFAPTFWAGHLTLLLSLAAVGTTLLLGRFLILVWPSAKPDQHPTPSLGLVFPWAASVLATALTIWLQIPGSSIDLLGKTITLSALWPVLLGAVLVYGAWRRSTTTDRPWRWHVPQGDVLILGIWIIRLVMRLWDRWMARMVSCVVDRTAWVQRVRKSHVLDSSVLTRIELALRDWDTAACVLILLLVVIFLSIR